MPILLQFTSLQAAVTEIQSNQVCLDRSMARFPHQFSHKPAEITQFQLANDLVLFQDAALDATSFAHLRDFVFSLAPTD
ncbi:hypothetical protein MTP99_013604 [Tenebrio molitor]|nr:hypothetical protein MTP99_013604 [Tenebrio molitor]